MSRFVPIAYTTIALEMIRLRNVFLTRIIIPSDLCGPPYIQNGSRGNVWEAMDVKEANRALREGIEVLEVAQVLAARRMAREQGTYAVRRAVYKIPRLDKVSELWEDAKP